MSGRKKNREKAKGYETMLLVAVFILEFLQTAMVFMIFKYLGLFRVLSEQINILLR